MLHVNKRQGRAGKVLGQQNGYAGAPTKGSGNKDVRLRTRQASSEAIWPAATEGIAAKEIRQSLGKLTPTMLRNAPVGAGDFIFRRFWGAERRTAASYERELTEIQGTEARLRQTLGGYEALLCQRNELIHSLRISAKECDHRLLNNLQMVVSLLLLQSRGEENADAASRLSLAANRVATIACVHRHLHSMDGTATVAFKQYVDELCREYSTMLASQERSARAPARAIVVKGIEVKLPTVVGIPLSLVVNELVTNAIKHGKGRITVKLLPRAGNGYALSVCNDGSVLPKGFDPAASHGLGMSLILSLVEQIGGELQIDRGDENEGTRFTVVLA